MKIIKAIFSTIALAFIIVTIWRLSTDAPPPNALLSAERSAKVIDIHAHTAGLGYGNSGCFINQKMRDNIRFKGYMWAMSTSVEELAEHGDAIMITKLSRDISASKLVDQAVVLAMDGYIDADGLLSDELTQVYVPNDYLAAEVKKYDNLLFGASINPNRKDALDRLQRAYDQGAVLVKWIPSIMNIDPSDPRHIPFYQRLAALKLPLLSHTGQEKSFADAKDELADPQRLILPLEQGVTVIAAHIASTGQNDGQDNFDRILPMFERYDNLYTDISSLTQANKLNYLAQALEIGSLDDRLLYGSDWPLLFFPLVSPWYHVNHIPPQTAMKVSKIHHIWDRDIALKRAFKVPESAFYRANEILRLPSQP